ncbi:MAG: hypothetical protein MI810_03960 [Flavobacteriales bacterium]|nr:hypothetical protein [Flavobacteriales bacterium]
MVREESNAKIDALLASLEKGFDGEKLVPSLMDLREDALQDEDPLLAKVLRLSSEYITEEGCFDHTVEKEEDEEGEEYLLEPGTDAENLSYLLQLIKKADNKFNREEIKEMRTFLKQKLY